VSASVRARLPRAAAAVAVATALVLGTGVVPASAGHRPGPSAGQVAAGRAAVAHREAQVRAAAAALVRAQQQLGRLRAAAEIAVEAYDAARVRQQTAEATATAARLVVATASHRVAVARGRLYRFAATAYMSGGMSSLDALLTSDGPESLFYRVGTLEVISRSERDVTEALDGARVYLLTVQHEADLALARATAAARAADRARARVAASLRRAQAQVARLRATRRHLDALLQQARRHASALERARLAAILAARRAAAARAAARAAQQARQQSGSSGATGDVAGTVSPQVEAAAVRAAESQLGKPYQWGAAGPDSYDCSGLTMWAYAQEGVHLDHYTGDQWQEGARISTSALRPGDLVFFATNTADPSTIHHVGMYVGNGEMVEAPHTGANVRYSSIWRPDLIGAVRPYAQ
jgi:cell wall-associated NlpC family hydrolase